ncbi:MAG TPA: hypothetical protein VHI71_00265 [Actinomycetota bacterium]|nr:hypothetical protein [Actinomycetota bacterium]
MGTATTRTGAVALAAAFLLSARPATPTTQPSPAMVDAGSATAGETACSKGYARRWVVAHGRFLGRRWKLSFYRDRKGRPCLATSWSRYGSIFRFRVRDARPRLALLDLDATTPPHVRHTVYVMAGYAARRVARLTFRIDGKTDDVGIVRSPRWTRLRKDLFVHFVGRGRFDRDARGRLRAFDRRGRLLAERVLRRRQFYESAQVD